MLWNCSLAKRNAQRKPMVPGDPLTSYAIKKEKFKNIAPAVSEKLKIKEIYIVVPSNKNVAKSNQV